MEKFKNIRGAAFLVAFWWKLSCIVSSPRVARIVKVAIMGWSQLFQLPWMHVILLKACQRSPEPEKPSSKALFVCLYKAIKRNNFDNKRRGKPKKKMLGNSNFVGFLSPIFFSTHDFCQPGGAHTICLSCILAHWSSSSTFTSQEFSNKDKNSNWRKKQWRNWNEFAGHCPEKSHHYSWNWTKKRVALFFKHPVQDSYLVN